MRFISVSIFLMALFYNELLLPYRFYRIVIIFTAIFHLNRPALIGLHLCFT